MLSFVSCYRNTKEKAFLAQYEFEDFSNFCGTSMIVRGITENKDICIYGHISYLVNNTLKETPYYLIVDKKNYQIKKINFIKNKSSSINDSLILQQLVFTFMEYQVPRLEVDIDGNVFVYLKDVETLGMVKFANKDELLKRSKEMKWVRITENWYKPKY